MLQKIVRGYQAMLADAESRVARVTPVEAQALLGRDDVVFVDIRDPREREREGRIPGAFHCTRGMLEFWIDPESPYHRQVLAEDKRFVFFCASGWRSALAADTAQAMGLKPVAHLEGGFSAWKAAGGAVETAESKG